MPPAVVMDRAEAASAVSEVGQSGGNVPPSSPAKAFVDLTDTVNSVDSSTKDPSEADLQRAIKLSLMVRSTSFISVWC